MSEANDLNQLLYQRPEIIRFISLSLADGEKLRVQLLFVSFVTTASISPNDWIEITSFGKVIGKISSLDVAFGIIFEDSFCTKLPFANI